MNRLTTSLATFAALLAGGLIAVPAQAETKPPVKSAGVLHVYDVGSAFTGGGIDKAKAAMGDVQFDHGLTLTIDTYSTPPAGKTAPTADGEKAKFFQNWARDVASSDKGKGIYVLICRSPGYVEVIADKTTLDRGFTSAKEQKLRNLFLDAFNESKGKPDDEKYKLRDAALLAATNYVINDLKDTNVTPTSSGKTGTKAATTATPATKKAGMSIGGWICIGLCVLLCVWLVIGLIRALTGGGGGGGGGYGGGGGGGGGFGMGLMGGLFGAMAGMWLYNSMMGTHYGNDAYAGGDNYNNNGNNSTGDNGTSAGDGDFGGDAGAGGSYDDGGTGGGGDYGGGGGDYGGGDTGGGGDYGGGGGDYGGGDF